MWKTFNLGPNQRPGQRQSDVEPGNSETQFRILVLADFSGRGNRQLRDPSRIASAKPILIDRDNFDEVLAKLAPKLELPLGGGEGPKAKIAFAELDDFHPDRIFKQVDLFDELRSTRRKLLQSSTFQAAAEKVRSWAKVRAAVPAVEAAPADAADAPPPLPPGANLLEAMLGQAIERPPEPPTSRIDQLMAEIVAPYVVPKDDPQQEELVQCVDDATSQQMRKLLHHADFQALEAAWRGLYFIVRRLATDASLKIFILDVSRSEIEDDLDAESFEESSLYKVLVERTVNTPGAQPWAMIVSDQRFAPTRTDAELLGKLGRLAARAGAPLVAAATDACLGCSALSATPHPRDWHPLDDAEVIEAWSQLRSEPAARFICITVPRFLLRFPFGRDTSPAEEFDFEEFTPTQIHHEHFLWGSGAFAATYLIADGFSRGGWDAAPGSLVDITDLPAFVYEHDGDSELLPCAEVMLIDEAIEKIADSGLTPLVSIHRADRIRVAPIQSIAAPAGTPLSGRWRG